MYKKLFLIIVIILSIVFFFSWSSNWVYDPSPETVSDMLWRGVMVSGQGYARSEYAGGEGFATFESGGLFLYGRGVAPSIDISTKKTHIFISSGDWVIRNNDPTKTIIFDTDFASSKLSGTGTFFVNTEKKTLANIDGQVTLDKPFSGVLLASFYLEGDKQIFFDIAQPGELLDPEVWKLYVTVFPRDKDRALGRVDHAKVLEVIDAYLAREPIGDIGFFRVDLSARKYLEEIRDLVTKIATSKPCGTSIADCQILINYAIEQGMSGYPKEFQAVKKIISLWLETDTELFLKPSSWLEVYQLYHARLMAQVPNARILRDRAILDLIQGGEGAADITTMTYLTDMLTREKSGTVYSTQIVREMLRVGAILYALPETTPETKVFLSEVTTAALKNARDLLENTYFIKKNYLYLIRSDLTDSTGRIQDVGLLKNTLQLLIADIASSPLLVSPESSNRDTDVIVAQLNLFYCIIDRNVEYTKNPRVCRAQLQ